MSELIKHECGIAFIRLKKPIEHYIVNYGTPLYGLDKLHLLMEKQHNRGQDGAGIANVKLDVVPGQRIIRRALSNAHNPINDIFTKVYGKFEKIKNENPDLLRDVNWLKTKADFTGEVFLGHLRYGTFGGNNIDYLHPVIRENNWKTRSLVLAGNFNLTNVDELFKELVSYGQYPIETSDTNTVLEKIGNYLDRENERLYQKFKQEGYSKVDITPNIIKHLDLLHILKKSAVNWDGGYAIGGIVGDGNAFIMRDPAGIRPLFYYENDEVIVAASERPVIQTTFNAPIEEVKELPAGNVLLVSHDLKVDIKPFTEPRPIKPCSFERIYFSRGTDRDIYLERKKLGEYLVKPVLQEVDYDFENTVFSYIPNTAAVAFYGMIKGLNKFCNQLKKERILTLKGKCSEADLDKILSLRPRIETIAVKDVKMRTFITEDQKRDDLVAHVYDVTYGIVNNDVDNLVIMDDSIVRGTTLKRSIIRILDRLHPKKIIIVSSAPQIRYPDCYGIDMAKLGDFIAFNAAIELLKENQQTHIIDEVYQLCKAQEQLPKEEIKNHVKKIYEPFTAQQISDKIAQMIKTPKVNAEISVVYQTIEELHKAIPVHNGDWYFSGNYPTPGGNKVVNKAFINYIEGKDERAY